MSGRARQTTRGRVGDLIDAARARAELQDFGGDTWREGLEILVGSAEAEANLNAIGELGFYELLIGYLVNRLEIEEWYRRFPEIDDAEVAAPLFGLGLPRTGSTALAGLLAEDPDIRYLRTWESSRPCPPPETAHDDDDPRIATEEAAMEVVDGLAPRFKVMLPRTSAARPNEDHNLIGLEFNWQVFETLAHVPSYSAWWVDADHEPAYRYEKRALKLLQWRRPPKRWRLKSPSHMFSLDDLVKVFPDARFVMTHRDVQHVIPSVADLHHELAQMFSDHVDKQFLGQRNVEGWSLALARAARMRASGWEDRFFDIGFRDFQSDPIAAVDGLYEWLGEELTDEARTRMRNWWETNPRDKYGAHAYRPGDYGIDLGELADRFRDYHERFAPYLE